MPKSKPVARSSQGLVAALFDAIDRLNEREITPEEARAVSHTARTIVGVAMLELKARQIDGGLAQMKTLQIDVRPSDPPQPAA